MHGIARLLSAMALALAQWAAAAQFDARIEQQNSSYNSWNWQQVYVMANDLVTVAAVPAIGGRVMRYELGGQSVLWVNPAEVGKTYTPPGAEYDSHGFGGSATWPAPQSQWHETGWPPPQFLDYGQYTASVVAATADSVVLLMESPVQGDQPNRTAFKGLQLRKRLTLYKGSTRLRVEQRLINKGTAAAEWAVWDVTRVAAAHSGQSDYDSFHFYFAKGTGAADGSKGYFVLQGGGSSGEKQLTSDVKPGIVGLEGQHRAIKVGARSLPGWIAWVDEKDGLCYVKKQTVQASAHHPDSGSTVQVYVPSGGDGDFMEMEVLGPQTAIAPNDSNVLVIDWYAARTRGPIVAVNRAGVTRDKLSFSAGRLTGRYGVFHRGRVDALFNGQTTAAATFAVSPADSLVINQAVTAPAGAGMVALLLYDAAGQFVDTLDRYVYGAIGVAGWASPTSLQVRVGGDARVWGIDGRVRGEGGGGSAVVRRLSIGGRGAAWLVVPAAR